MIAKNFKQSSSWHYSSISPNEQQQKQRQKWQHVWQRQSPSPRKSAKISTTSLLSQFNLFALALLLITLLSSVVSCVVVYQVRLVTKSGRTDYTLAGESIELTCHYIMKDEAEDIKQLVWSKDGKNFLRWRKNKPGLEVLSYTFKGHIDYKSINSHIHIHNITIDMHGKYKCSVKTDLGVHEMEQDLIVISQSNCRLNDWRVISQPSQCRELFKFDCKNMFPKPVPSCGLWNEKLDKFIRSVTVDISEEPNKQTYRVRYSDKFDLQQQLNGSLNPIYADLLQYAGHLVFKCDIIVPETSWRLSLVHKMFDYEDGCNQDPLETVEKMRLDYTRQTTLRMQQAGYLVERHLNDFEMLTSSLKYEFFSPPTTTTTNATNQKVEFNCWQKPRIGSLAKLSCSTKTNDIKLVGANLLECQPSGWVPVTESTPNMKKLARIRKLPRRPSRRVLNSTTSELANLTNEPRTTSSSSSSSSNQREPIPAQEEMVTEFSVAQGGSNDLEDTSSSTLSTPTLLETATTKTDEREAIPSTRTEDSSGNFDEDQSDTSFITTVKRPALTQAQLASLLPTCVSTRHRTLPIDSNRLPMLDEVRILESSNPNNRHHSHDRDNRHNQNSIFNFSSSGSKSTLTFNTQQVLALLLLMLTTSLGLSISNVKQTIDNSSSIYQR